MKFRTSLGLLSAAIALTFTPVILHSSNFSLVALADEIRSYGSDGANGRDGRSGEAGQPGRMQSIRVEGMPQQVYVVGGDGRDGEDGDQGDRPYCPAQPRQVRYDLVAPDGGNGGDGGDGGRGGRGGDVTLYYADVAHLQQVLVNAAGGRAGRGGRGGRGAAGCRCDDRSWRVQVCKDGNCREERYECRDGENGYYGRDGRNGESGAPGTVWLVNQTELLKPEQPTVTQPLETFLRQPVPLSKNLWETRNGARSLLASSSVVADTYHEYVGRIEAQAQIVWQAARSQSAFLALSPTVTLEDSGNLQLAFPDTYWTDGFTERNGNLTTYTLTHIVRADEVTNLAWGSQSGRGDDFAVTVIDLGRESEFIETQFELVYRTTADDPRDHRRARYQDRFVGPLPAEVVVRDNNRFVINLGQLPIDDRYFQSGTFAQVELRIGRSLGQNSAAKTLQWEGQL